MTRRPGALVLAALFLAATIASWLLGIWTSDDRWGLTGLILLLPAFLLAVIAIAP